MTSSSEWREYDCEDVMVEPRDDERNWVGLTVSGLTRELGVDRGMGARASPHKPSTPSLPVASQESLCSEHKQEFISLKSEIPVIYIYMQQLTESPCTKAKRF